MEEEAFSYRFVVCPVTWRYKSNHTLSKIIFSNSEILKAIQKSKEEKHTVSCGSVSDIVLPTIQEKVQVVLLVNGPNMANSLKPNCLDGDYTIGNTLLESCYSSVFQSFAKLCGFEGIPIVSE